MLDMIENFISQQANAHPVIFLILTIIGTLVVLATAIAPITKTKKDDEIIEFALKHPIISKILNILFKFSLINKK